MADRRYPNSGKKNNDNRQLMEIGKVQPQALDFEAAVIGACLIEQDAFGVVSEN